MSRTKSVPLVVCKVCRGNGKLGKQRCRSCHGFGAVAEIDLTEREMAIQMQLRLRQVRQELAPYAQADDIVSEAIKPRRYTHLSRLCPECEGYGFADQQSVACALCLCTGVMMENRPVEPIVVLVPMRKYLAQLTGMLKHIRQRELFKREQPKGGAGDNVAHANQ